VACDYVRTFCLVRRRARHHGLSDFRDVPLSLAAQRNEVSACVDPAGFIKERVGLFKDFTPERIRELVDGSLVRSFEANEAIAHQGGEATHLGVVLSGTVAASAVTDGAGQTLGQLQAGDTFAEAA